MTCCCIAMFSDRSMVKQVACLADILKRAGGDRGHLTSVSQDQNPHQYYNGQQTYAQPSHSMQQQYQQYPPVSQGYSSAPPGPTLPYGWIQQWDSNSQRYYYLEQATGRTQWDLPMDQDRGIGNPSLNQNYHGGFQTGYGHGYDTPANAHYPGAGSAPSEVSKNGKVKKDGNKGGMLVAGVGGLVLGGLAGAALAGDSSDDGKPVTSSHISASLTFSQNIIPLEPQQDTEDYQAQAMVPQ